MRVPRFPACRFLTALPLFLLGLTLAGQDLKVAPGTVEDQRFSDNRMGGMTIELKLTGASVKDVKAVRARVKSAKDNLGTDLHKPGKEEKVPDFEEFSSDRHPGPRISLSNPSRDATSLEVAGELEAFIPSRDPATVQKFEKALTKLDKPISSAALKWAKVEITPLSAAAYKARQQQNRPTTEQIREEGKKAGASEAEIQQAVKLMEAMAALGGEDPTETSVLLETKDPDGRIISIELAGPDGAELHAGSRGSTGGRDVKLVKIDLSEKPPQDTALVVTLRTPKSVVSIPLKWKEVALP
jgi:hypothetical protein